MEICRHGDMKTWRHGDMEIWTHGHMDAWTWRHGDMEIWRYGDMDTWTHGHGDMETSNGKRKPSRFSLICLPFAHRANGSLLFVSLLAKKQTEVICLYGLNVLNGPNGLAQLWYSLFIRKMKNKSIGSEI
jgi:hypothetical protein